jgi:hypothetical protein
MYARTNRCYNEGGYRTNYVRSSIPHCSYYFIHNVERRNDHNLGGEKDGKWTVEMAEEYYSLIGVKHTHTNRANNQVNNRTNRCNNN